MRKILKSIHSKISKIIPCILTTLALLFNPVSTPTVYAAPAVVPVAGEAIYALLVALGLMTGDAVNGYEWSSQDPYVDDIFDTAAPGFTTGVKKPSENNEHLQQGLAVLEYVMAENAYTTDGTDFFVGTKKVTPSDIFVQARALLNTEYGLPVNVQGITDYTKLSVDSVNFGWYSPLSQNDILNGYTFFPIYGYQGNIYYAYFALHLSPGLEATLYNWEGKVLTKGALSGGSGMPSYISTGTKSLAPFVFSTDKPSVDSQYRFSTLSYGGSNAVGNGTHLNMTTVWNDIDYATFLILDGVPSKTLVGDKSKLENAVVKVEDDDDNGNGGGTPPVPPETPNDWQIWQTITELIDDIDNGTSTNGGTTLREYINNNYNYVDVDINIPDEQNIHLTGGLDNSVDITIHEDVSLPDAGNGDGFFNPDAADAVAALNQDNPVIGLIKGVFEAIDPKLVAIFSVGISFAIVLGLWKLIRG